MSSYIELRASSLPRSPKARIELDISNGSIDGVLEELIKPVLLAVGFQQRTVEKIQIVGFDDEA